MQRPSYVLTKELIRYGLGAANLWPEYPLDFPTELGDIGWFGADGQFIRLFNCFGDGHRNNSGIPPNFVPLKLPEDSIVEIEEFIPAGMLYCSPGSIVTEIEK